MEVSSFMKEKELFIKEVRPGIFLLDEAHEATDKRYQQEDHVICYRACNIR